MCLLYLWFDFWWGDETFQSSKMCWEGGMIYEAPLKKQNPRSNKKVCNMLLYWFLLRCFLWKVTPNFFLTCAHLCMTIFFINMRQCWLSILKVQQNLSFSLCHFLNVGPPNGEHLFTTIYGLYCSQNCYITYLCRITVYFMLGITIVTHYLDLESRRLRNTILCHSVKCRH